MRTLVLTLLFGALMMGIAIDGTSSQAVTFTGNAATDFAGAGNSVVDPVGDVGLPLGFSTQSGWDLMMIYLSYDPLTDTIFVGLESVGIFGDSDGDGDPGNTGAELLLNGGLDFPDLAGPESVVMTFDLDGDDLPDLVVGNPFGTDINSFMAASFSGSPFAPQFAFGPAIPGVSVNVFASPSAAQPDLEFSITGISIVASMFGDINNTLVGLGVFAGSFGDGGIGEDFIPGIGLLEPVDLPELFATLGDFFWVDLNGDGIFDSNEPPLPGVEVSIFDDQGVFLGNVITDSSGMYEITVPPGSYHLQVTNLPGNVGGLTMAGAGSDDTVDSDFDPMTLETDPFTLGPNESNPNFDGGVLPNNQPPVPMGLPRNNKINAAVGVPAMFTIDFAAPEQDQTVVDITVNDFGLSGFSCDPPVFNQDGSASITCTYVPSNSVVNTMPMIEVTATDDYPFAAGMTTVAITFCVAECFMLVGGAPLNRPFGNDDILLVDPFMSLPMLLDDIPVIPLPNEPSLVGFPVYMQALLYNPDVFANDPVKVSPGLKVTIGEGSQSYGTSTGLFLHPVNGGVYHPGDDLYVPFSIVGF